MKIPEKADNVFAAVMAAVLLIFPIARLVFALFGATLVSYDLVQFVTAASYMVWLVYAEVIPAVTKKDPTELSPIRWLTAFLILPDMVPYYQVSDMTENVFVTSVMLVGTAFAVGVAVWRNVRWPYIVGLMVIESTANLFGAGLKLAQKRLNMDLLNNDSRPAEAPGISPFAAPVTASRSSAAPFGGGQLGQRPAPFGAGKNVGKPSPFAAAAKLPPVINLPEDPEDDEDEEIVDDESDTTLELVHEETAVGNGRTLSLQVFQRTPVTTTFGEAKAEKPADETPVDTPAVEPEAAADEAAQDELRGDEIFVDERDEAADAEFFGKQVNRFQEGPINPFVFKNQRLGYKAKELRDRARTDALGAYQEFKRALSQASVDETIRYAFNEMIVRRLA